MADSQTSTSNIKTETQAQKESEKPPTPSLDTSIVVEGQEPTPISPIDREASAIEDRFQSSLTDSIGATVTSQTSPVEGGINLPLPASSSFTSFPKTSDKNTQHTKITSHTAVSSISPPPSEPLNTSVPTSETEISAMYPQSFTPVAELSAEPIMSSSSSNPNRRSTVLDDPAFQGGMPHITDVTDTLLNSSDDFADYELLTGTTSPTATQLQKAAQMKEMKKNDPAVLYNIPGTPSAQAYQTAQENPSAGYFNPEFPEDVVRKNGD